MCRWMRSHFHDRIEYNGVEFSIQLLEWGRTFSLFLRLANVPECLCCTRVQSEVFFIQSKKWVNS